MVQNLPAEGVRPNVAIHRLRGVYSEAAGLRPDMGKGESARPTRQGSESKDSIAGEGAGANSDKQCRADGEGLNRKEARVHRDRGDRLYRSGQYEQAVQSYSAALTADSAVDGAFGGRAAALLMLAQYGAALHDALRAVDAVNTEGNTREREQGKDTAVLRGTRVEQQLHAHLLLAKTLLAMGSSQEASVHYQRVIDLAHVNTGAVEGQVLIESLRAARAGQQLSKSYDAFTRRAFALLVQTRDLFYIPIVGPWRSWRKTSTAPSHEQDLPGLGFRV